MLGLELSITGLVALLGVFTAVVGGWYRLNQKLEHILERNQKADKAHDALNEKVDAVEAALRKETAETRAYSEGRFTIQEERMRIQDVFSGRMEERFTFVEKQIGRILDILERASK